MVDTLIRFLHSQQMKVGAAEQEIRGYYQWRKEWQVDEKVDRLHRNASNLRYRSPHSKLQQLVKCLKNMRPEVRTTLHLTN